MVRIFLLYFFCTLLVVSLPGSKASANHIVGGELKMKPVSGGNMYEITLVQFWDENNLKIATPNSGGNRDETAKLFIYRKRNNELLGSVTLNYQSSSNVTYQNKTCATVRSLRTVQGIYTGLVLLDPTKYSDAEGYYIVWERCCRNGDINNIKIPGDNGMVFYMEFPPITIINSSPEFQFPNGQYICVNRPFSMNTSALDTDGDELRYSLAVPYRGNTSPGQPVGDDTKKNGYPLITWETGISLDNVIPGPAPLAINSKTGVLTVTASQKGLYVFTVMCEEYRNGKKIGLVRRDFQLLVIDCSYDTPDAPVVMVKSQPVTELEFCPEKPVELETAASNDWSYQWQLNGLNIIGATSEKITAKDSGTYTVVKSYKIKCSSDTSSIPIKLKYAAPVEAVISAAKNFICVYDSIVLTANGGKPIPANHAYSWLKDGQVLAENKIQTIASSKGDYVLFIEDKVLGCIGKDTVTISDDLTEVTLPEQVMVRKHATISVKAKVTPPLSSYTYEWSEVDSGLMSAASDSIAILGPLTDTTYQVEVTSVNGCISQARVKVIVFDKLYIPTAFSPNQDGENETFEIFNGDSQITEVSIYNRWGQVVFHSKGYEVPWNGNYNNQLVPSGTYPYRIMTKFGDYRGEVLLLR